MFAGTNGTGQTFVFIYIVIFHLNAKSLQEIEVTGSSSSSNYYCPSCVQTFNCSGDIKIAQSMTRGCDNFQTRSIT